MTSEQLQYLIAFLDNTSFNKAAISLNISFQALHKSIRNLEKEIGLSLVVSTPSGTQLTEKGYKLVKLAQSFFYELNALKSESQSDDDIITILIDQTKVYDLTNSLISLYDLNFNLLIHQIPYEEIIDLIDAKKHNLGIISNHCLDGMLFKELPSFSDVMPLRTIRLHICVSKRNKFYKEDMRFLSQFDGFSFVVMHPDVQYILKQFLPKSEIVLENDINIVKNLIIKHNFFSLSNSQREIYSNKNELNIVYLNNNIVKVIYLLLNKSQMNYAEQSVADSVKMLFSVPF